MRCSVNNFVSIKLDGSVTIRNGTAGGRQRWVDINGSVVQRYNNRTLDEAEVSLYEFARLNGVKPHSPIAVPKPTPWRIYNPEDPQHHELYCRDMLTLFYPWIITPESMLTRRRIVHDEVITENITWIALFDEFVHNRSEYPPALCLLREVERYERRVRWLAQTDQPLDSASDDENQVTIHDDEGIGNNEDNNAPHQRADAEPFDVYAAEYSANSQITSAVSVDEFPLYYGDDQYPWSEYIRANPDCKESFARFWTTIRSNVEPVIDLATVHPQSLSPMQRLAFSVIVKHYQQRLVTSDPLRMIISGTAGTGKSQIIKALRQYIPAECIKVAAPSGVAAYNVGGTTIHSLLKLPIRCSTAEALPPPPLNTLRELQKTFQRVRYILLDERSFIGQGLLYRIHARYVCDFPPSSLNVLGVG